MEWFRAEFAQQIKGPNMFGELRRKVPKSCLMIRGSIRPNMLQNAYAFVSTL